MKNKIIVLAAIAGVLASGVVQLAFAFVHVFYLPVPTVVFVMMGLLEVILVLMLIAIVGVILRKW